MAQGQYHNKDVVIAFWLGIATLAAILCSVFGIGCMSLTRCEKKLNIRPPYTPSTMVCTTMTLP